MATSDESSSAAAFKAANCTIVATPAQLQAEGKVPVSPIWPKVRSTMRVQHVCLHTRHSALQTFINTGFYEEQIFVHRDPFCLAQILAMVSNGTC